MADFSLADIKALSDDGDKTWGGNGFLWVILIFLFFLAFSGGNGLFGNNNAYNGLTQIERDVLTTSANNAQAIYNTSCATQKEILDSRYTTQLGFQNAQAQMAECCCNLRAEGLANTQKILDKLCENEINQLRTDLQSAQLQISQLSQTSNIVEAVRPTPVPAYITCSPYTSPYHNFGYGCGCNNF